MGFGTWKTTSTLEKSLQKLWNTRHEKKNDTFGNGGKKFFFVMESNQRDLMIRVSFVLFVCLFLSARPALEETRRDRERGGRRRRHRGRVRPHH